MTVSTNGTIIHEDNIPPLIEHTDSISISLDGPAAIHDKLRNKDIYHKTLETIKAVRKLSDKKVNIKTTVTKYSLPQLKEMHQMLESIGINNWDIFPAENVGRAKDNPDLLLSKDEYNELCNTIDEIKKDKASKIRINFEEGGIWFLTDKA